MVTWSEFNQSLETRIGQLTNVTKELGCAVENYHPTTEKSKAVKDILLQGYEVIFDWYSGITETPKFDSEDESDIYHENFPRDIKRFGEQQNTFESLRLKVYDKLLPADRGAITDYIQSASYSLPPAVQKLDFIQIHLAEQNIY